MTLEVWQHIRQEAKELAECEPMLASFFHSTILKHQNLGSALSYLLANKLANPIMPQFRCVKLLKKPIKPSPISLTVPLVILKLCATAILLWNYGLPHCFI